MNIYHIYLRRDGAEQWFALALYSQEQATLLGKAFPDVSRIETWNGEIVYNRKRKATVH